MPPFGDWLRGFGKRRDAREAAAGIDDLLTPQARPDYDRISALAAEHGWACVYVSDSSDEPASFGYTVGLNGKGLPELLFCVEEGDVAMAMLNAIAKRLVEHGPGIPDGFEPFPGPDVRLRNIYAQEFFEKCVLAGLWAIDHGTMPGAGGMQVILAGKDGSSPPE